MEQLSPPTFPERMSVENYLAFEKEAEVKHEYVMGEIHAMAGASKDHERLALSLASSLLMHLRGGPCEVFKSDMKVHAKAANDSAFYYPDIVVGCDPNETNDYYLESPKVIIEVLSPTSGRRDRAEKFFICQQIESLEEYVLIEPNFKKPEVIVFRKVDGWAKEHVYKSGEFILDSIGFTGTIEELYGL